MVWSNWQGAIWRGAMLVLLFWSGLAWTQTPAPIPSTDPAERIMVVHESGKSTRCRVMEAWQLPDGRVAHLLQAIETAEMITIVDEPGHYPGPIKNSQAMPKRIFAWGMGRRSPPEGSPIPPHLRFDSGIVIKNETPAPVDAVPTHDAVVVNRLVDERALGGSSVIRDEGPITMVEKNPPEKTRPTSLMRFPKRPVVLARRADSQVVAYDSSTPVGQGTAPMITKEVPMPPIANLPTALVDGGQGSFKIDLAPPSQPTEKIVPNISLATSGTPIVNPVGPTSLPSIEPVPTPSGMLKSVGPTSLPSIEPVPTPTGMLKNVDPNKQELYQPVEPVAKKRWYPGANIQAWLQSRSTATMPKTETAKTAAPKTDTAKADESKKLQQAQDFLAQQNKVVDKQLTEKIEKMYGTPFSTARMPAPNAPQPEMKKPDSPSMAIANTTSKDDKPPLPAPKEATAQMPVPNAPQPEMKKPDSPPMAIANTPSKDEKLPIPAPKDATVKPTDLPSLEKRDMWGNGPLAPVPPPGKSVLDQPVEPPNSKPNDPLLAPEKLVPNNSRLKPKAALPAPIAPDPTETTMEHAPPEARSNSYPARPVHWPLGTQSVQAANSGLSGNPMYIPVPTVTVPQPQNPPVPPAPKLPEAPNLNAYVNAFTPPPPPKAAPQQQPMQGLMPPQAFVPYCLPMMAQQQMMIQQQILAQQEMMRLYGYRPNPAMMSPYMPQQSTVAQGMPSQGPMANVSRQYMGPQAPNPFAANPAAQTGNAPAPYPPMAPMQAMMPQQPAMQPVAHQQQPVPTQHQALMQRIEQLIKVMRESPYPAQREWAAQSLTSFEWRDHPQIVPALIQSASQDPAASVRAGCVYCLGRMQAAVEPVFGTLHVMRNDMDPRVRAEVEQALVRLGKTPTTPN